MKSFRPTSRRSLIAAGLIIALVSTAALIPWRLVSAAEPPTEPPTLEQIKARLKEQQDKIKSVRVEYRRETKAQVDQPQLLSEWHITDALIQEEIVDAFKGDKQYRKFATLKGTKPLFETKEYVRFNPGTEYAFNGTDRWEIQLNKSIYVKFPNKDLNWFGTQTIGTGPWIYFHSTGLGRQDQTMVTDDRRTTFWLLPNLLDRGGYRVQKNLEKLNGTSCVVIEGPIKEWAWFQVPPHWNGSELTDRLWLDLDHGLALRKREFRAGSQVLGSINNSEFKEASPGYWLPQLCEFEIWPPVTAAKEHQGKPAVVFKLIVKKLGVNDVEDKLFDIPADVQVEQIPDNK